MGALDMIFRHLIVVSLGDFELCIFTICDYLEGCHACNLLYFVIFQILAGDRIGVGSGRDRVRVAQIEEVNLVMEDQPRKHPYGDDKKPIGTCGHMKTIRKTHKNW